MTHKRLLELAYVGAAYGWELARDKLERDSNNIIALYNAWGMKKDLEEVSKMLKEADDAERKQRT